MEIKTKPHGITLTLRLDEDEAEDLRELLQDMMNFADGEVESAGEEKEWADAYRREKEMAAKILRALSAE